MQQKHGARALKTLNDEPVTASAVKAVITVLHIDDDPNDTELLRAASQAAKASFMLVNVEDGDQAIAYLSGREPYVDRNRFPLPKLILLDLKMPRATGFEVLRWIKQHPELGKIPVKTDALRIVGGERGEYRALIPIHPAQRKLEVEDRSRVEGVQPVRRGVVGQKVIVGRHRLTAA